MSEKTKTPFGDFQDDSGLQKAPTKAEMADDPAKFEGTIYDPLSDMIARTTMQNYSKTTSETDVADGLPFRLPFPEAFRVLPVVALRAFASEHDGHLLNMAKLSARQRALLGL